MSKPIEQILAYSRTAINNALANAEILTALAASGYHEEKLRAGLALHNAARTKYNVQVDEYGDKAAASAAMKQARKRLSETYSPHVKVARVAFKNDAGALADLRLNGARRRTPRCLAGASKDVLYPCAGARRL